MTRAIRTLAVAALAAVAVAALPAAASAYDKPAGGKWNYQNLFDRTKAGALSLSKDGKKVTKLILKPGADYADLCGKRIVLVSRPKVRSYKKVNGRYAVARLPGQLFKPIPVRLKVDGKPRRGTLMLLWDETGRLLDTGKVEYGDCLYLSFYARKGR